MLHILILSHNDINSLKECLNHIYNNTSINFNIFILDNNSTDNTKEYLKNLKKENLYINFQDKNLGIIKGRNKCYDFSKKINNNFSKILFLDSDQYVLSNWDKSYLELFEKRYDIIGCEAWKMRNNDFYPYKKIKDKNEEFNYCGCGGMCIKKSVIDNIELFDEQYKMFYWEDPDFIFRAYQKGYKIGWNYNPIIEHQKHNLRLKGDRKKYFLENWKKFQIKWKNFEIPVFKMG